MEHFATNFFEVHWECHGYILDMKTLESLVLDIFGSLSFLL